MFVFTSAAKESLFDKTWTCFIPHFTGNAVVFRAKRFGFWTVPACVIVRCVLFCRPHWSQNAMWGHQRPIYRLNTTVGYGGKESTSWLKGTKEHGRSGLNLRWVFNPMSPCSLSLSHHVSWEKVTKSFKSELDSEISVTFALFIS